MITINALTGLLHSDTIHREYSPIGAKPALLLDLTTATGDDDQLTNQLSKIPCPIIGIGTTDSNIAAACDTLAASRKEAESILTRIRSAPIAALTLTQLLRATEPLSREHALTMESMAYATLQGGPEFARWLSTRKTTTPTKINDTAVRMERNSNTLIIEINRPETRNAISTDVRDGLIEALQLADADPSITHIDLRGAGKCFSTGGELAEFGLTENIALAHVHRSIQLPAHWMVNCSDRITAHLHSACIGAGIEIPAFASTVIAKNNSFFQLPELSMGLIPGAGGCVSIPRRIGRQRTAWLVLSGRKINAATALSWGLIDDIIS
ncbi:MAG: enoyl-CoA hydratase/isomerase family protein [Spongiibacteraceae bacterium]